MLVDAIVLIGMRKGEQLKCALTVRDKLAAFGSVVNYLNALAACECVDQARRQQRLLEQVGDASRQRCLA